MPVLHSLQRTFGNHTIAGAIRDGLAAPGQPLEHAFRTDMERRLGHDFSNVRVHVDGGAAARVEARAFAFGDDIVLASHEDRATLPHELTHVAQQRGRILSMPTRLSQPHETAERQAEASPAPEALHRTPAAMTTCPTGSITLTDGTVIATPVDVITTAENTANAWLDRAIDSLSYTRRRIVTDGAPIAWPTIGDTLAAGLRLLGINPNSNAAWTGSETTAGTVAFVLKRYRDVRAIVGAGTVAYTCQGETVTRIGACGYATGNVCRTDNASTCAGSLFTALCEPFWKADATWQARVILHEHFHVLSAVFSHAGRADNIMCYERLAQLMSNVPVASQRVSFCGDVAP